jgi:hypothetical protein
LSNADARIPKKRVVFGKNARKVYTFQKKQSKARGFRENARFSENPADFGKKRDFRKIPRFSGKNADFGKSRGF